MATANTLDVFGDGSCLDLITLDGHVDTVNNGSFSVTGDPATFVVGMYGQAYKGTLSTTVKMTTPRILPTGKRTNSSISFWMRQRSVPSDSAVILLYDDNDWGGVIAQYDSTEGYMVGIPGGDVIPFTVVAGVMHNIVIEFDATLNKMYVYVDKVLKVSLDWTADRGAFGIDECWLNGAYFSGEEYRSEHDIDQVRFFNRSLISAEREILFDEGTFGTIFRDMRISMQGQSTSFLDTRELSTVTTSQSFLDTRVSMGTGFASFLDVRLLNTVENKTIFLDVRQTTGDVLLTIFEDTRFVHPIKLFSFKDVRIVEVLHLLGFKDVRGVAHGRGIIFSDIREVNEDFKYTLFNDIRRVETEVLQSIIIERVNI